MEQDTPMIRSITTTTNPRCKRLKRIDNSCSPTQINENKQQYDQVTKEGELDSPKLSSSSNINTASFSNNNNNSTNDNSIVNSIVPKSSLRNRKERREEGMLHKWQLIEAWDALERTRRNQGVIDERIVDNDDTSRGESFPMLVSNTMDCGGHDIYNDENHVPAKLLYHRRRGGNELKNDSVMAAVVTGGGRRGGTSSLWCGKKRSFLETHFQ